MSLGTGVEDLSKTENRVYRLYAMTITQESVELAETERFTRITPSYVLIYTLNDVLENAVEILPDNYGRLTSQDKQWLIDCHAISFADQLEEHKEDIEVKAKEIIAMLAKQMSSEDGGKVVEANGNESAENG